MRSPVRATAGWLAGRFALLFVIVAALVVYDAFRDESSVLVAQLKGFIPDAGLVRRLEQGRGELGVYSRVQTQLATRRLMAAESQSAAALDERIVGLEAEIARRTGEQRSGTQRTLALLTGRGFEDDVRREIDLQLLAAERDALERLRSQLETRRTSLRTASEDFERKRQRILKTYAAFAAKQAELDRHERGYFIRVRIPGTAAWARARQLRTHRDRLLEDSSIAAREFRAARTRRDMVVAAQRIETELVESAALTAVQPLDDFIVAKREGLQAAARQAERLQHSVRSVFFNALVILVLVTLAPIGMKAFWYWVVAPAATRRPPIRLMPQAVGGGACDGDRDVEPTKAKASAVSLELTLGGAEEVLVHPDYLQSSSDLTRKDTRWLLHWQYPLTSIAAGMVALTRIRGAAGESLVVSSRRDPFSEVGVIPLPEGAAVVLQPRSLVGVVQAVDRPVRIESRWRVFSLGAWITFQFRYLIFIGPGRLIVQGCRGVRIEQAGRGRSIDQAATIGFSANLDYAPRRSETFGAYLMGVRGLFNDNFAGGPGFYVYEEMPYFGRKAGITGRGLEGLTDALLKVFGI